MAETKKLLKSAPLRGGGDVTVPLGLRLKRDFLGLFFFFFLLAVLLISSDNELRELQRAWCRGKEGESCAGGCSSPGKVRAGPKPPRLAGNHTGRNAAPGWSSAESRSIQKARGCVGNSERLGLSHGREEEQLEPSNRNFLIFWGERKGR